MSLIYYYFDVSKNAITEVADSASAAPASTTL